MRSILVGGFKLHYLNTALNRALGDTRNQNVLVAGHQ